MKQVLFLLIVIINCKAFSQQSIYPEILPNAKGYSKVIAYNKKQNGSKNPIQTSKFDENGFCIESTFYLNGKPNGKQKYSWNKNGELETFQNFSSYAFQQDSEGSKMIWQSATLSNEIKYLYKNSRVVNYQYYGTSNGLELEMLFVYDSLNRIVKEEVINHYLSRQNPQLDSTSWLFDQSKEKEVVINDYKMFDYSSDTIRITYYRGNQKTGYGKRVFSSDDQLIYEAISNNQDEMVYSILNSYNKKGLLINQVKFDTGNDGYGNTYDFYSKEIFKYRYRNNGNVKSKSTSQTFNNERFLSDIKYKYKR